MGKSSYRKSSLQNSIRIHNKKSEWDRKSIPRLIDWYYEACRVTTNGNHKGHIFLPQLKQKIGSWENTVNPEIFRENLIFANSVISLISDTKFATRALFTYISKRQSDFGISRGYIFTKLRIYMRSFAKIKPSLKFPNLQYVF